ncbi:C40 family peptidase [Streptomyces sp. NPDC050161]|uniref:C40 family peptidase n=1 Tax=Streptomyces sp. NPDC050161 TaxID=3365604 RepID=UPI0037AAA82A
MKKFGCCVVLLGLLLFGIPLGLLAAAGPDRQGGEVQPVGAVAGIPARMLHAYQRAAARIGRVVPGCKGMTWAVVAGVAKVESGHAAGRRIAGDGTLEEPLFGPRLTGSGVGGNTSRFADTDGGRYDGDPVAERAVGPFQFMPATWAAVGQDGNGDGTKDPQNADDAALSAAVYLCGEGRDLTDAGQLRAAVYSYNRSEAYVAEVTGWIGRYSQLGAPGAAGGTASGAAKSVINAALAKRGVPYSWGGGNAAGPSTGSCCSPGGHSGEHIRGFDCSGLTLYAYAQAGVTLPRLASAQAGVGKRIPPGKGTGALRPGDLVFFAYAPGADSTIYHVGIYLGGGQMLDAARPGTRVREEAVWQDGYAGGARVL